MPKRTDICRAVAASLAVIVMACACQATECVTVKNRERPRIVLSIGSDFVVVRDGTPLREQEILFHPEDNDILPVGRARTDSHGRTNVPTIKPGTYGLGIVEYGMYVFGERVSIVEGAATDERQIQITPRLPGPTPVPMMIAKGTVTDETGAVIPRAALAVYLADKVSAPPMIESKTDAVGEFKFSLDPGLYELVITKPGFIRSLVPIRIVSAGRSWKAIRIQLTVGSTGCGPGNPYLYKISELSD